MGRGTPRRPPGNPRATVGLKRAAQPSLIRGQQGGWSGAYAQRKLESAYPQLFLSDKDIQAERRAASDAAREDPDFKKAVNERAAAYRVQQDYLLKNDARLAEVARRMERVERVPE